MSPERNHARYVHLHENKKTSCVKTLSKNVRVFALKKSKVT